MLNGRWMMGGKFKDYAEGIPSEQNCKIKRLKE
jgi:hypothetical protein